MTIATVNGVTDPSRPFPAFGPPLSALHIDHPLLHERRLARIELDIDWARFPRHGLKAHYRDYLFHPPIRNASFSVAITAPLAGWGAARARGLFAANGRSRFTMEATGRRAAPDGPVRLTLVAPDVGFGNEGYAPAVMAASIKQVRLPKPPWLPMVACIALRVLPA